LSFFGFSELPETLLKAIPVQGFDDVKNLSCVFFISDEFPEMAQRF